jgi:indolepyruvate ferredoxin oxidoreductase
VEGIDAEDLSLRLLGDTIFANMFLMGYAYQLGEIPIGEEAILRAIELNGAAVKQNQRAFRLGRLAAHDRKAIETMAGLDAPEPHVAQSLDELVAVRATFLEGYQNRAYADRYRVAVDKIRSAEAAKTPGQGSLANAVARSLFKLMAYKDEYEVARLYTNGDFLKKLNEEFEGNFSLQFHLAPPVFGEQHRENGRPRKMTFGPWMMGAFRLLAAMRRARGTWLDIFGRSHERQLERRLVTEFESDLLRIGEGLTVANHAAAIALAELPLEIKGYGYIKDANHQKASAKRAGLWKEFEAPFIGRPAPAPALTVAAE